MRSSGRGRWWAVPGRTASLSSVRSFAIGVLCGRRVPSAKAAFAVDALLAKDLQGDHLRGIGELPKYVAAIDARAITPRSRLQIVSDHGGAVVVDGGRGLLFAIGYDAIRLCIARSRTFGIAFVGVRNQVGRLEPYLSYASEQGVLAFGTILSPPLLAATPAGAARAGNNPVGLAARGRSGRTILFDGALSLSSAYAIRDHAARKRSLPDAYVFDQRGRATRDPTCLQEGPDGTAIRGSLIPIGGYKGYGLAAAFGVLSGPLLTETPTSAAPPAGTAFVCIDPKRVGGRGSFPRRLDGYLDWLSETPGGTFPGEASRRAIRRGQDLDLVPLNGRTRRALRAMAKELAIKCPF